MNPKFVTALLFWGTGALAFAQQPTITSVLDAASYTPNISQGGVFVVKGTNLASASNVASAPYPKSLSGVSINFAPVAGGAVVQAYMIYTYSQGGVTQLAGLLPSNTAAGDYNVTVTAGLTSAAFKATVVVRKFGLMTQPGTGNGRALIQDVVSQTQYDLNGFTSGTVPGAGFKRSPATPGEFMIAWGIGLGPAVGFDASAPSGGLDFSSQLDVKVLVGATEITPAYAGRSNLFPGLDNIAFQLPSNAPTGCTVNLQVRVNGQLSNATTIAIAPSSQPGACVDPQYSQTSLSKLDNGGSIAVGVFELFSSTVSTAVAGTTLNTRTDSIGGSFTRYTADDLTRVPLASALPSGGACQVASVTSSSQTGSVPADLTTLNAGAITLNGPNASNKVLNNTKNVYSLTLSSTGIPGGIPLPGVSATPVIAAGTYTLGGAGGSDVGSFNASVVVNSPLTITGNLPTTIVRSQNLPIAWTGGGTDIVTITGTAAVLVSGTPNNNPVYTSTTFTCITTADKGSFTVPSPVLSQLPAVAADALTTGNGYGALSVFSGSLPSGSNGTFTAPLAAGGNIDSGLFLAAVGISTNPAYQ